MSADPADTRQLEAAWMPGGPGIEPSIVFYARRELSPGAWRRAAQSIGLPDSARRLGFPLLTADHRTAIVHGRALEVPEALRYLVELGNTDVQPSVRLWQVAALFARRVHEGGVPPPGVEDTDTKLARLAQSMPRASHALIVDQPGDEEGLDLGRLFEDEPEIPPTLPAQSALTGFINESLRAFSLGLPEQGGAAGQAKARAGKALRELILTLELPDAAGNWRLTADAAPRDDAPWEQDLADMVLDEAARVVPALGRWHLRGRTIDLSTDEASQFVGVSGDLAQRGVTLRMPESLLAEAPLPIEARVAFRRRRSQPSSGGEAAFRLDELVQYDVTAALGDQEVPADKLRAMARDARNLVNLDGNWVALTDVTRKRLDALARAVEERDATMGASHALTAALAGRFDFHGTEARIVEVDDERLRNALDHLKNRDSFPEVDTPEGFQGELRDYQLSGLAWLAGMSSIPLGACLADDMGLGKTIQLISVLLNYRNKAGSVRALIVCPTSLIGNWERELERFAPGLRVHVHHGTDRGAHMGELDEAEVVVTSYGLVARDTRPLGQERSWDFAVFDEAQAVKNPETEQARACRKLTAGMRIALTGTPVENRLLELWAILDLLNPGLLGSLHAFRRNYALPVEQARDEEVLQRLRAITSPFILRRVKDDPLVAPELPAKDEHTIACTLTAEQATLYQAVLDAAMRDIRGRDGIGRRGAVLALLTRLKQICNHPLQYTRAIEAADASEEVPGRSGKLDRLVSMLEEVVEEGDRALVFSQYATMAGIIHEHLGDVLECESLYMHGGVTRLRREELIARFQEDDGKPRIFVMSLRTGGLGLNLMQARHVFHFDQWWNPAVEDQATDRTHRIGQTQAVQVHRLVCAGTIEERISEVVSGKRVLARQVVDASAGDSWITELGDEELEELVSLSRTAVPTTP